MKEIDTMSAAVIKVIDGYPVGHQFHGNELHDDVTAIYPEARYMYPDTILRMARRHRRGSFKAANKNNSLYEKIGIKSAEQSYLDYVRKLELEEQKRKSDPVQVPQQARWLF